MSADKQWKSLVQDPRSAEQDFALTNDRLPRTTRRALVNRIVFGYGAALRRDRGGVVTRARIAAPEAHRCDGVATA